MIYEVKTVHGEPREWSSSHGGTFLSYTVDFVDEDGMRESGVEWTKKPESQPPTVGERVAGHIEPGKFAEKFKIDYEATKELNQGGGSPRSSEASTSNNSKAASSAGETNWTERNAEIRRQHSQEMAIRVAAILEYDQTFAHKDEAGFWGAIQGWADKFDQDAIAAGQYHATAGEKSQDPVDFSGARTEEPIPPKPSVNFHKDELPNQDLDDYRQLLSNAGLEPAAARDKAAEYMGVVLPEDRLNKAVSGLQDLDRQGTVLAQLKAETEQWMGGPLPQGDALDGDDSSIPFHHPEYREPGHERMRWRF